MVEENDGLEEALEGQLRVLVTAAGQIGGYVARARAESAGRARFASEREARELATRQTAEQRAAHALLAPVSGVEWWQHAIPTQIAHTYQVACAWAGEDLQAARAERQIREKLRAAYGIDVDNTGSTPAAMHGGARQAGDEERQETARLGRAELEIDEAEVLFQAGRRHVREQQHTSGGGHEGGGPLYDSAARRAGAAADLAAAGVDGELVAVLMRADVSQSEPARHAISARTPALSPSARSGLGLGRKDRSPAVDR